MSRISKAAVTEAPSFAGLSPEVGGAAGEMVKIAEAESALVEWHEQQLEMQRQLLDEKLINEELYASNVAAIHEELGQKMGDIQSSYGVAAAEVFSSVAGHAADMAKSIAGENSGIYKALFIAQKAFAVAAIIMNAHVAAAKAPAELTVLGGIPVGQALLVSGYANAGMVAGMALAGMAHDGIDSVPNEGTWLLDRGERVVDARTNADLKSYLNDRQGSDNNFSESGFTVQIINNSSVQLEASQTSFDRDRRIVTMAVKEVARQLSENSGDVSKSLKSRWNVNSKAD